ncbi:alpha-L-fucosidase [Thalassotalea sp. SU-HH00458]|uniref:alpha-L-fucosidase n=1 Tax=Thalassotalea sp. SU-HH00458 TaxID=3127657 RepID=UPI00310A4036
MKSVVLLAAVLLSTPVVAEKVKQEAGQTGKYADSQRAEKDWEHIDSRPIPAWWQDAKFGIFIHWGVYSVPSYAIKGTYSEWYWHNKDGYPVKKKKQLRHDKTNEFHDKNYGKDKHYSEFAPEFNAEMFDPDHWANVFQDAGAKYVVLTSKHHDGYTLWPNKHASDSFGMPWNSQEVGPKRDLVGELTNAVNKTDVKMGLYYSLWDWFNPVWEQSKEKYVDEVMLPQMYEVVEKYKPEVFFTDGDWIMDYSKWRSLEFLDWLTEESSVKDSVVFNDRWGKVRKNHGGYYTTEYGAGLADNTRPWEENRGIGFSFGFNRNETLEDYNSAKKLVFMLVDIVSRGGNFLLDIGPTADGRIPVIMEDRLIEMGKWMKVNGEAIYGTRMWKHDAQWSEGINPGFNDEESFGDRRHGGYDVFAVTLNPPKGYAVKELFFTQKDNNVYAMMPSWPTTNKIIIKDINTSKDTVVTMLGVNGELSYQKTESGIVVELPTLLPGKLPAEHVWTLKVTNAN